MAGEERSSAQTHDEAARFRRVAARDRTPIRWFLDGAALDALDGDTVLTAVLCNRRVLRLTEWRREPRAGFCLMGACQDCWLWGEDGSRLRACSTPVTEGLRLRSRSPLEPAA